MDFAHDATTVELTALTQRTLAHAKLIDKRPMADLFVVVALQTKHVATLFDRAGVGSDKLLLVLVHGKLVVDDDAVDLGPTEPCEVVFHDDDVTTMELVIDVLMASFEMNRETAAATMLKVHGHDLGVVAVLPAGEARRRVILARELVRVRGAPLRISLRRAGRPVPTRT